MSSLSPAIEAAQHRAHLLALSADTFEELTALTERLRRHLQDHPEHALADVASAVGAMRPQRSIGGFVVCMDRVDALEALRRPERIRTAPTSGGARSVAFLFPGLGEQYVGMAAGLYQTQHVFRRAVDDASELVASLTTVDLREALALSSPPPSPAPKTLDLRAMLDRGAAPEGEVAVRLDRTEIAQPAVFVIEYALAQLWMSWGIRPDAMLGYSIGEYVAACLAGVLSLPDALRLVTLRARLIGDLPPGAMLALARREQEIACLLGDGLSLAAVNGEALCVVAGPLQAIERLQQHLMESGEPAIRIRTTHAFHSTMMAHIVEEFRRVLASCSFRAPQIPYVSNVTGTWMTAETATDPQYWIDHLCQPVRFAAGAELLWREPGRVFLEVGPGANLTALVLNHASASDAEAAALPSLRASYESTSDEALLLDTLGRLWLLGVPIDWRGILGQPRDRSVTAALEATVADVCAPTKPAPQGQPHDAADAASRAASGRRARPKLFTAYVPATGTDEQMVIEIWQNALKIDAIGANDNFFELGGHSLLAISIVRQLSKKLGSDVPLGVLFANPSVAQLARALGTAIADTAPSTSGPLAHSSSYVLPNGLEILHQNKAETDHFYEDIFDHRTYVRHVPYLPDDACVFDVGANIGLFSLFIHTIARRPTIYAFEPSAPTFAILQQNVSRHQVNARLLPIGLSDREGTADFTFYPFSSGMSSVYGDHAEEEAVLRALLRNKLAQEGSGLGEVAAYSAELIEERLASQKLTCRLRPLSSILREERVERIDLLKIDVQKSELDVLRGIEPNDWHRIRSIAIEIHDTDGRVDTVAHLLKGHGYDVVVEQDPLYRGTGIFLLYGNQTMALQEA